MLRIYIISSDKVKRKQTPCKLLHAVKKTLTQESLKLQSSWSLGVHLESILPRLLILQHFLGIQFYLLLVKNLGLT